MPDVSRLKAEFFKTMGHPVRIRILEELREDGRTVSELLGVIDVEQPYLSQQLGVLRRAGVVEGTREGANVVYTLADPRVADLLDVARQVLLSLATATRDELRQA